MGCHISNEKKDWKNNNYRQLQNIILLVVISVVIRDCTSIVCHILYNPAEWHQANLKPKEHFCEVVSSITNNGISVWYVDI